MRNVFLVFTLYVAACMSQAQIAVGTTDTGPPISPASAQSPENVNLAKINIPGSPNFKPELPVVTAPRVKKQVDPKFSRQAQKSKFQGIVVIQLIVDEAGVPRNPQVTTAVGHGLDEAALEAVKQWRFIPAKRDGRPVAVAMKVEVDFHIY